MESTGGDDDLPLDVFEEPSGYYQPEKPHTFAHYTLKSGRTLSLRLLGFSPLWVNFYSKA
jgi:EEF1A N-terminal glycine/lysine methyltransferase